MRIRGRVQARVFHVVGGYKRYEYMGCTTCTAAGQVQCLGGPEGLLMHCCRISRSVRDTRPQISEAAKRS